MSRAQPNPKYRTVTDLNERDREHHDVAATISGWVDKARFVDAYRTKFPDRNPGSIIPSDYCFNRENKGNSNYPRFLEWDEGTKYCFVGLEDRMAPHVQAPRELVREQPAPRQRRVERTTGVAQDSAPGSPSPTTKGTFPFEDSEAISHWSQKYWDLITQRERDEERLFEQQLPEHRRRGFLPKSMFVRMARWKSPRKTPNYESNDEHTVEAVTRSAIAALSAEEAVAKMMKLHGVALRTATALLHWLRPDVPILDFRVVEALGLPEPKDSNSIPLFTQVAKVIRDRAHTAGIDLRQLDRAMWAWQKAHPK